MQMACSLAERVKDLQGTGMKVGKSRLCRAGDTTGLAGLLCPMNRDGKGGQQTSLSYDLSSLASE